MRLVRKDFILVSAQAFVWIMLWLIPPLINFLVSFDPVSTFHILRGNGEFLVPLALIYFLNYCLLIPFLSQGRRRVWFWINVLVVISAVGARYAIRWNEMQIALKEEKQRNAEAELAWLKNQLNPHFLFNTLNNISSLVQIDQDTAQESIGQLSDLLRYTLYESNHELVPVEGEIEFMNNYIELMRLRCNELATVEVDLQIPIKPMRIVPLLFISLIENAFKHGVNSRKSSFVRIRFKAEGDDLVFTCENSDHPKPDVNRSGSGIGLENLRRRLDLAYPGRYRYDQALRENSYFVQITLRDCL